MKPFPDNSLRHLSSLPVASLGGWREEWEREERGREMGVGSLETKINHCNALSCSMCFNYRMLTIAQRLKLKLKLHKPPSLPPSVCIWVTPDWVWKCTVIFFSAREISLQHPLRDQAQSTQINSKYFQKSLFDSTAYTLHSTGQTGTLVLDLINLLYEKNNARAETPIK